MPGRGKLAGINKDSIKNLLTGKSCLGSLASSVANDVAFGFNGGVAPSGAPRPTGPT